MTLKTEAVGTVGWRGIVYRTAVDLQAYTTLYETVCHCLLGSVSVVFKIYRAMALLKFSSRRSARHSEAQLRLALESTSAACSPCTRLVSCPASLSHAEKESGETRIQFWFHTYVTYSDTGTMNVIISDGAITV